MSLETFLKQTVLNEIGISIKGTFSCPKEGRIANNLIIDTFEYGLVFLRCYHLNSSKQKLGYGTKRSHFELEALTFLSSEGAPVPSPLRFRNGKSYFENNEWFVFIYKVLEGETLNINLLSNKIAKSAGQLLHQIINMSSKYKPNGTEPDGDLNYIREILKIFINRRQEYKDFALFKDLFHHLSNETIQKELDQTPKGLVHGDYFYENVLTKDGAIVAVIDFGDSYYGFLLTDIVIGSMEFSIKADEEWDMNYFQNFINGNKIWLIKHNISFELFYYLLLANCIRFIAHIFNLDQDKLDENSIPKNRINFEDNIYVHRFYKFQEKDFYNKMKKSFEIALTNEFS